MITAAALLLLAACKQESDPLPEYRPAEAGTVDHALCLLGFTAVAVRTVSTGHQLVQVSINGKSGSFVLDTGANLTVVNQGQAERFGLSGQSGIAGLGASIRAPAGERAQLAKVERLQIGSIAIRQERVMIANLDSLLDVLGRATGETVSGIIGQDVLDEHRAIIDVARPMLYLMKEDREPAPVAAETCQSPAQQQGTKT
ncbi:MULTISPECIES: retropepsin-like aspartic protease family protein [Sphingobium]|jgi:clan AA aspartic protease (TIGR02281 family)|uniref:Clan AA aspartic protease n=2 Tax=Sphingobium TaxID=165695 RepID=A0A9X7UG67_SPHYA|nr:retropepsin-like aspartic protease [Sphingobium yanoikuyae]QNG48749.1 clan AA aspartic protease [Sphingobium yanoikuyae]